MSLYLTPSVLLPPSGSDLTFSTCLGRVVALLLTLEEPGRQRLEHLIPAGAEDMLWWSQHAVHDHALDTILGLLYEVASICEEADTRRGLLACDLLEKALRQVWKLFKDDCRVMFSCSATGWEPGICLSMVRHLDGGCA